MAAGGPLVGTVTRVKRSEIAGVALVVCGATAIAVGARGQWVANDPLHVWVPAPITEAERNWLLGGAVALGLCAFVGLVGMLRWLTVVAWVHAGGALLFTMLDVQSTLGSAKPATGASLGWGPWVGLGGIGLAVVGLMAMLRHDLDDAPVPEPKRTRRSPGKRPAAKPVAKRPTAKGPAKAPAKSTAKAPAKSPARSTAKSAAATSTRPPAKKPAGKAGAARR